MTANVMHKHSRGEAGHLLVASSVTLCVNGRARNLTQVYLSPQFFILSSIIIILLFFNKGEAFTRALKPEKADNWM